MRLVVILVLLAGCAKKNVVRSAGTFTVETLAALKRQEEAAAALHHAATKAKENGDTASCLRYIKPALLIDAAAQKQAYRALWLADLPYPDANGDMPPKGVKQEDPGPSEPQTDPEQFCRVQDKEEKK